MTTTTIDTVCIFLSDLYWVKKLAYGINNIKAAIIKSITYSSCQSSVGANVKFSIYICEKLLNEVYILKINIKMESLKNPFKFELIGARES